MMYSGSQKKTNEGSEVRIGNEVRKERGKVPSRQNEDEALYF